MDKKGQRATQADLAGKCRLNQGTISRILNGDTRSKHSLKTVAQVMKAAREFGYLHPALVSNERRRNLRKNISSRAQVKIVIGVNTIYDQGKCLIDDISQSGMLLRNFRTTKMTFPLDRFHFFLDFDFEQTKVKNLRCEVARFLTEGDEFGIAVKCEHFTADPPELLTSSTKSLSSSST